MTILAWYSLIMISLLIVITIADNERSGASRLIGTLLYVPVVIFLIKYLFN